MGSVAGEKITRCLERAAKEGMPAIIFCASGGSKNAGRLALADADGKRRLLPFSNAAKPGFPYICRLYRTQPWQGCSHPTRRLRT